MAASSPPDVSQQQELASSWLEVLSDIAQTGAPRHPWNVLKELVRFRLVEVCDGKLPLLTLSSLRNGAATQVESVEEYRLRLTHALDSMSGTPFTIQRLSELLVNPAEHHRNIFKYLRALEKVMYVTSPLNNSQSDDSIDETVGDLDSVRGAGEPVDLLKYFGLISTSPISSTPSSTPVDIDSNGHMEEFEDRTMDLDVNGLDENTPLTETQTGVEREMEEDHPDENTRDMVTD
ncbi:protein phosphatase 4 core regulatory subunit R2 [Cladochytrium replicatum]|nr:protein phosphatase 4 core regulatory subunit R2 [Cladochytrium replicatum]